jgi:hypothetical protein
MMSRQGVRLDPLLVSLAACAVVLLAWLFLGPSATQFADFQAKITGIVIVSILALCLLLTELVARPLIETLWAWIFTGIFIVGYYFKAFYFPTVPDIHLMVVDLDWVDNKVIANGLWETMVAFVAFCLPTKVIFLTAPCGWLLQRIRPPQLVGSRRAALSTCRLLAFACLLAYIGASYAKVRLGLATMGQATTHLPRRADTLINRSAELFSALLLTLLWLADFLKSSRVSAVVLVLFLAAHFVGALVSTSRGALFSAGLLILFLWLFTGKLTRSRAALMIGLAFTALVAIPVLSALRQVNLTFGSRGEGAPVLTSAVSVLDFAQISAASMFSVFRVTGADDVWHTSEYLEARDPGLRERWSAMWDEGVPVFFTRHVVGLIAQGDYRAPGFVGTALLLGGIDGLAPLIAAYTLVCYLGWAMAARSRIAPVACSLTAVIISPSSRSRST